MKPRGLLIAVCVLAVLTGVLYWSNHRKPDQDAAVKASPDAPIKVLSLDPSNVVRLTIHRTGQPQVDLSRDASGNWQITAPAKLGADRDSVAAVLSTLASLKADRLIDDHASDVRQFGLAAPALQIDLSTKDNKTQQVLMGDQTPTGNDYYLMLSGDPRLFTVAADNKTSIDKTSNDLRDKRLLTADFDDVAQVEYSSTAAKAGAKEDVTFARDKDGWEIVKPQPERTESDQVDALIQSLRGAKMDVTDTADAAKNTAAFNSAAPFVTAKVTGKFGTQELEVRKTKDKDEYYAKSSALPGVYTIAAADGSTLNKSPDDFRKKALFDFGYDDPDKIEIHDGSKAYFVSHSGSDWWGADGKKLDPPTVNVLLTTLRGLSATNFPASGFAAPVIQITVISNDNKRTEKVVIAKVDNSYVAKRDNEAELYGLPNADIADIEQSAAGLKPADTTHK